MFQQQQVNLELSCHTYGLTLFIIMNFSTISLSCSLPKIYFVSFYCNYSYSTFYFWLLLNGISLSMYFLLSFVCPDIYDVAFGSGLKFAFVFIQCDSLGQLHNLCYFSFIYLAIRLYLNLPSHYSFSICSTSFTFTFIPIVESFVIVFAFSSVFLPILCQLYCLFHFLCGSFRDYGMNIVLLIFNLN